MCELAGWSVMRGPLRQKPRGERHVRASLQQSGTWRLWTQEVREGEPREGVGRGWTELIRKSSGLPLPLLPAAFG